MTPVKVMFFFLCTLILMVQIRASPLPHPDSAGVVELPPGAAYGGIPYGSVTGMVAKYYNGGRALEPRGQQPTRPVYY